MRSFDEQLSQLDRSGSMTGDNTYQTEARAIRILENVLNAQKLAGETDARVINSKNQG